MGAIKDGFDNAFRDYDVTGLPSSGDHEPVKSEIRAIGSYIEQSITSSGMGAPYPSTTAGLAATTNGQNFLVQATGNDFARLYRNVGGVAVDQNSAIPNTAYVNLAAAPDRPINETGGFGFGVTDFDNRYGGGTAIYLPLSTQYFRSSAMSAAGFANPTNADVGGRMASFTKLAITQTADSTLRVIFNYTTQAYELLEANVPAPARYITLGILVVGQNRIRGQNGFPWISFDYNHIFPLFAAVIENGQILIPQFSALMTGAAGFSGFAPENGAFFFERAIQPDATISRRYIVDKTLKDVSGGTSEAAVKYVDGVTAPLNDGYKQVTLATCIGGAVSSEYFQLVGDQGRPPAIDQSPFGFDADALTVRDGNATVVDFTDPTLLALGVTRGFTNPATTGTDRSVYFGTPLRPKIGQLGVVRFFAQIADGAGNFDNPRCFLRIGNSTVVSYGNVKMIRRISATSAEFIGWIGDATGTADNLIIGFDKGGVNTYRIIVSPFSFHFSDVPAQWIGRPGPAKTDLAYGDQLFATRGRPLILYPGRITKNRQEMVDFVCTIGSGTAGYTRSGKEMIVIDPDQMGSTIDIRIRNTGAPNNWSLKRADVYIGPASVVSGSTVRILANGDSLVGYGLPASLAQSGQRRNYTVQTIGTLINDGGGTPTAPLHPGEGHPGKTVAQMVGKAAGMDPIAPTGYAAYLDMSDDDKNNRNAFLKPYVVGTDPLAYKVTLGGSDYVWSMAYYISRNGFVAPTHFVFSGGRNDIFFDPTNAVANVEFAFDVRYNQTRAAYPTAPIIFTYFGEPLSVENARDWPAEYAIIMAYIQKVRAARLAGDLNVWFVSPFAHTTAEMWSDIAVVSTDVASGTQKGRESDTTHMGLIAKPQAADCIFDAINATSGAAAFTLPNAATDAASTQDLVNALRDILLKRQIIT